MRTGPQERATRREAAGRAAGRLRLRRNLVRFLAAYLAASLVAIVVLHEAAGGRGHAHVPFSMFPEYLVLTPLAPVLLGVGVVAVREPIDFVAAGGFAVVFAAVWIAAGALARQRGSSRGAGG